MLLHWHNFYKQIIPKSTTGRRQSVGYLKVWPRIWIWNEQETNPDTGQSSTRTREHQIVKLKLWPLTMKISIMPALHFMLQLKHYVPKLCQHIVSNRSHKWNLSKPVNLLCKNNYYWNPLPCLQKVILVPFWIFFFSIIFFFDIFLLYKLSVLVNHSPQSSCMLMLNQELTCLSALVKIMYLFC